MVKAGLTARATAGVWFVKFYPLGRAAMKRVAFFLPFLAAGIPAAHLLAAGSPSARVQVVDERGLPVRDAVVEITPAAGTKSPSGFAWRAAMAQKDLQFTPGTLIVAKGATVAFPNLDKVRHSIYSFSKIAKFEIDLYGRDQTRTQRFAIAGTAALGCNIHDAMRGYVRVVDTPYAAKTNANGIVDLSDVPSGKATITVWHPRLRAPANETNFDASVTADFSRKYTVKLR